MLGVVGETRYVMGCISQLEDGRYFLEDLSASLPVDLIDAQLAHGFITGRLLIVPHRVPSSEPQPKSCSVKPLPIYSLFCVKRHFANAALP